ncbi:oxidoreductase [Leifsonia sp. NPDC058230]|uniref:oxidoreductase n=1 Tax=Leifsonia sp. NPDC058230 TaxID=3346391 RepID=UPI0036D7E447
MSRWLITGCSTGLGRALAEEALTQGHSVVVTARDAESISALVARFPETAIGIALDVTDERAIADAVQAANDRFGGVDVLVNNAGYGFRSAVEEADLGDVERLFDTNVFGPVSLMQRVLPGMRARRSGVIVNISSIAARWMPAGSGFYAATKSALEGISGSLRKEVAPLGIAVIAIEPGGFRTDFAGRSLTQSAAAIGDYAETAGKRRIENDTVDGTQPGDPRKAAKAIIVLVESADPPQLVTLGSDALNGFRDALTQQLADADRWAELSTGTDF